MKKLYFLVAVILTGIASALTYHFFENAVHAAIDFVWYDTFNTDSKRLMVIPLAIGFSLVYFGLVHWLDRDSEDKEEHGLGGLPKLTVANYAKVLLIGFFSLLAGATLGPEAILVPACMLVGGFIGAKIFKTDKQMTSLLAAAGLMALFTAFFDSFWIGVLSLLLVLAQSKTKFKPALLLVAVLASGASKLTLNLVEGKAFATFPSETVKLNVATVLTGLLLVALGFVCVEAMSQLHKVSHGLHKRLIKDNWLLKALLAAIVLVVLYLIGGPLVEFTGNRSIVPMFDQAAELGLLGLLWILVVKIVAISWSKGMGYRGGVIFPTIFVAAVLVAMAQQVVTGISTPIGIVAVIVGALISNKYNHVLV